MMLDLPALFAARNAVRPHIRRTPLERSHALGELAAAEVFLKLECFQVTGSFKPRGSFYKLLGMSPEDRRRGVIASTAGNHGVGLSHAAAALGVNADIYLPRWADPSKIAMLEQHGARLTFFDSVEQAREQARADARASSRTFVSAYNDSAMIAGGGTLGLEICEELPDIDLLVVCVGGGGLAAGAGLAAKALNKGTQVWGVQAENSPKMTRWAEAGHPISVPLRPSIAEGLAVDMEADTITFPVVREVIDRFILVSEDEIREAMWWLLARHQLLVEPSGAVTVAALRKEAARGSLGAVRRIAAVLSGRNVSAERYRELIG